jgi:hypothetical protein
MKKAGAISKTPDQGNSAAISSYDVEPISGCTDIQMTKAVHSTLAPSRLGMCLSFANANVCLWPEC